MIIFIILVSLLFGAIGMVLVAINHTDGSLRVDRSIQEDDPYLFLELANDLGNITKKKVIVLRVRVEDFIPRK